MSTSPEQPTPSPEESAPQTPAEIRAARRAAAVEWLNEHWAEDYHCPVCGNTNWIVGDMYLTGPVADSGPEWPPAAYAFVPLTCQQCGNVLQLNAVTAGLAEPRAEAQPGEQEEAAK